MSYRILLSLLASLLLVGCTGLPEQVQPIQNFELSPYLGRWYEIARLDHSFERGLSRVSAEYSLRDDGGVMVLNRGYSADEGEWKEATGKAYLVGAANVGHLKVSFFGPFYSSYVIFDRDGDDLAYVSGYSKDYLWLLSRSPQITPAQKQRFIDKARALGFEVEALIWVTQGEEEQTSQLPGADK